MSVIQLWNFGTQFLVLIIQKHNDSLKPLFLLSNCDNYVKKKVFAVLKIIVREQVYLEFSNLCIVSKPLLQSFHIYSTVFTFYAN